MTVRVYCPTCESMVHPTDPHSCFSAAAHREYREAEEAVVEAAKAFEPHVNDHGWERNLIDDCTVTIRAPDGERAFNALTVLLNAIATLRGLHGHEQSDCGHVWVDVMYGQYCKNCRAMRSVSQEDA